MASEKPVPHVNSFGMPSDLIGFGGDVGHSIHAPLSDTYADAGTSRASRNPNSAPYECPTIPVKTG